MKQKQGALLFKGTLFFNVTSGSQTDYLDDLF